MAVVAWQTGGIGISKIGSMKKKTLTPRQAHFARCLAGGASQSSSYREAYQPSDSTTAASIHTLASRVAGKVEVRSRVDALIKARERAVVQSALTDREKVTNHLRSALDGSIETSTNQLRAAELLGKSVGLFKDVTITSEADRPADDVAAEIERRLSSLLHSDDDAESLDHTKPSDLLN